MAYPTVDLAKLQQNISTNIANSLKLSKVSSIPDVATPESFLQFLGSAQSAGLSAQAQNIQQYGPGLRDLMYQTFPELQRLSTYYSSLMEEPVPDYLVEQYRRNYRSAVAAAGWGPDVTSPGIAEGEAAQLTAIQEQARVQAAGAYQSFAGSIVGMTGLGQVPDYTGYAMQYFTQQQQMQQQQAQFIAQLQLAQAQFEAELLAAREQSAFAQRQYSDYQRDLEKFYQTMTPKTQSVPQYTPYGGTTSGWLLTPAASSAFLSRLTSQGWRQIPA